VNATVNATGTKVNTATATTSTPETNTANNTASATTIVTAPAAPPVKPKPKPKPQPQPQPEICTTVLALPKTLKANGSTQKIVVSVKKGSKAVGGAKVKVTGAGTSKAVSTGKNGKILVTIKPNKPGIVRVEIVGTKACNTQRLGVVGVFEPPVTG
jgi:hypothetical protein